MTKDEQEYYWKVYIAKYFSKEICFSANANVYLLMQGGKEYEER